jgi:hypothetical protein
MLIDDNRVSKGAYRVLLLARIETFFGLPQPLRAEPVAFTCAFLNSAAAIRFALDHAIERWKNNARLSTIVVYRTMPRGMPIAPPIVHLLLQDQNRFLCAFSFS